MVEEDPSASDNAKVGSAPSSPLTSPSNSSLICHSQTAPHMLKSASTSHTWPFGAIAELVDNSQEVVVDSTYCRIDMDPKVREDGRPGATLREALVFEDDGCGMDRHKLHQMLGFGYSNKEGVKGNVGRFGMGFKTSSMRLGRDVIIFTQNEESCSVAFFSQTYLELTKATEVKIPIVSWPYAAVHSNSYNETEESEENKANLKEIFKYSPYGGTPLMHDVFKNMAKRAKEARSGKCATGTRVLIYGLRGVGKSSGKFSEETPDFNFVQDKYDIAIWTGAEGSSNKTRGFQQRRANQIFSLDVPEDRSLRSYLEILYLRPRIKMYLRGKIVTPRNPLERLKRCRNEYTYKPNIVPVGQKKPKVLEPMKCTLGFYAEKREKELRRLRRGLSCGLHIYNKNRLIRLYEKFAYQLQQNSVGKSLIGVVEVDWLEPVHNKQGFDTSKAVYSKFQKKMNELMRKYWQFQTVSGAAKQSGWRNKGNVSRSKKRKKTPTKISTKQKRKRNSSEEYLVKPTFSKRIRFTSSKTSQSSSDVNNSQNDTNSRRSSRRSSGKNRREDFTTISSSDDDETDSVEYSMYDDASPTTFNRRLHSKNTNNNQASTSKATSFFSSSKVNKIADFRKVDYKSPEISYNGIKAESFKIGFLFDALDQSNEWYTGLVQNISFIPSNLPGKGDRVLARWKGGTVWYAGIIQNEIEPYSIRYTDGEVEHAVQREFIRFPDSNRRIRQSDKTHLILEVHYIGWTNDSDEFFRLPRDFNRFSTLGSTCSEIKSRDVLLSELSIGRHSNFFRNSVPDIKLQSFLLLLDRIQNHHIYTESNGKCCTLHVFTQGKENTTVLAIKKLFNDISPYERYTHEQFAGIITLLLDKKNDKESETNQEMNTTSKNDVIFRLQCKKILYQIVLEWFSEANEYFGNESSQNNSFSSDYNENQEEHDQIIEIEEFDNMKCRRKQIKPQRFHSGVNSESQSELLDVHVSTNNTSSISNDNGAIMQHTLLNNAVLLDERVTTSNNSNTSSISNDNGAIMQHTLLKNAVLCESNHLMHQDQDKHDNDERFPQGFVSENIDSSSKDKIDQLQKKVSEISGISLENVLEYWSIARSSFNHSVNNNANILPAEDLAKIISLIEKSVSLDGDSVLVSMDAVLESMDAKTDVVENNVAENENNFVSNENENTSVEYTNQNDVVENNVVSNENKDAVSNTTEILDESKILKALKKMDTVNWHDTSNFFTVEKIQDFVKQLSKTYNSMSK